MRYNKFGKLDIDVSILGFGAMRLPMVKDTGEIDEETATEMIHTAIDNGVNYFDTAYPYHNKKSESFLGKILGDGYGKNVMLATKLPPWLVKTQDDCERIFNEQRGKLKTDTIDFYLFHALNGESWARLKQCGAVEWAEKKISDGSIRYLGFSFHGEYKDFIHITDDYEWTFCQIQYNYIDVDNQAGKRGLLHAASKGMAVVVMEPLLGGKLVESPPHIGSIWDVAHTKRTPVEWALRWLWDQPEVTTVLSGMSSPRHVRENLLYAGRALQNNLSDEEHALYERVRAAYKRYCPIPCTMCRYCMPCPSGIDIPWNMSLYNDGVMYESPGEVRVGYRNMPKNKRADQCTACGQCEELCPQGINISEWMSKIHRVLGEGETFPELAK
ncbi:MAG: aldo/keto reductase [Spirochaetales bacterium]|nr:aldo/keto reductase [Spirochaetales bacterium]